MMWVPIVLAVSLPALLIAWIADRRGARLPAHDVVVGMAGFWAVIAGGALLLNAIV